MSWAVGSGLISGVGNNTLAPSGSATRAQIAVIMMRFCNSVAPVSYTVTFEYNYGNKGVYKTVAVGSGQTVDIPTSPTRNGYSFIGWYTAEKNGEKFNFDTIISEDVTLYARWIEVIIPTPIPEPVMYYTVTFEADGENVENMPENQQVNVGECVRYPGNPTREGFIFAGWYSKREETDLRNQYDFTSVPTDNLTLFAKWINPEEDVDGDGIPCALETYFGSNPNKSDTDEDGLNDYEECVVLGTNATLIDTDGDGLSDFDEDADADGMANGQEFALQTNPIAPDTDLDGLLDGEEINCQTDPMKQDNLICI